MIKASLSGQLFPSRKLASIARILHQGGYAFAFHALVAGNATISWYQVPPGAHIAKAKAELVATGSETFKSPGANKLKLHLTEKGRRLLKHMKHLKVKRLKLTAKGTFESISSESASAERTFKLGR